MTRCVGHILMPNAEYYCRPTSQLSFANNVGLYINSEQTINMTVAHFVWVTMIWRFGSNLAVNYVTFGAEYLY